MPNLITSRNSAYGLAIFWGFLFLTSTGITAQTISESNTRNEASYAVIINGGATFSQGDIKPMRVGTLLGAGFGYKALHYLDFNLNIQKGEIKAGLHTQDNQPQYSNNYYSIAFNLRFYPIAIIEKKERDNIITILAGLYAGTGIGYIKSNTLSNRNVNQDWGPMGRYTGADLYVPLEVGFLFPVARLQKGNQLFLNANYCLNLCFSDEIDGYVPTVSANKWRDAFSVLSLGIGLKF